MNLNVTVNGRRKVFYGTASDPASLVINQKEGKLSDVIHAGDFIEFIPAVPGVDAKARLGDVEGVSIDAEVTLNGMQASLKTMLKNGDVITVRAPKNQEEDSPGEGGQPEREISEDRGAVPEEIQAEPVEPVSQTQPESGAEGTSSGTVMTRLGRLGGRVALAQKAEAAAEETAEAGMPLRPESVPAQEPAKAPERAEGQESAQTQEQTQGTEAVLSAGGSGVGAPEPDPVPERPMIVFQLNGSPLRLPQKEDGRPYYLMDLIQYSGIDLDHPKGAVTLKVNGEAGRFQQVLRPGDIIDIGEEERP